MDCPLLRTSLSSIRPVVLISRACCKVKLFVGTQIGLSLINSVYYNTWFLFYGKNVGGRNGATLGGHRGQLQSLREMVENMGV